MVEEHTDEELVYLVQQGSVTESEKALSLLLTRHYQGILRMAFVATNDSQVSLDCAQEILLAIVKGIPSFRGDSKFSTWVYGISRRLIPRIAAKHSKRSSIEHSSESPEHEAVDPGRSQEQSLLSVERQQEIYDAINALPEKQREAVQLYYYQDLPLADIAERISCSAATVKAHLYKARASLAKTLSLSLGDNVDD